MAELKNTSITGDLTVSGNINTQATKLSATLSNLIYPVGSLYWSSKSTDPKELFGGEWTPIQDRFVFAQGNKEVNSKGGHEEIKIEIKHLPSHNHSFTGSSGSAGSHSHNMAHWHTVSGNTNDESGHTHNMAHQHSFSGSQSHRHIEGLGGNFSSVDDANRRYYRYGCIKDGFKKDYAFSGGNYDSNTWPYTSTETVEISGTTTGGKDTTGGGSAHKHSLSIESGWAKNYSGQMDNTGDAGSHTHTISGTIGDTGGNENINIMPPYVVKYCWERTK